MSSFKELGLSSTMLANLEQLGFTQPTGIQVKALPPALAGKDVIAMAQTGSGKTAAFGIPLIEKLQPKRFAVQALVLCPTRELADQVAKALRELARAKDNVKVLTLCGGVSIGPQIGSLSHGAHIIVGTPGRVDDHLRKGTLSLEHLNTLVLDEADRMLDMGFEDVVAGILAQTPSSRQTLLFSATWPMPIRTLSERFQVNPEDVRIEVNDSTATIEELFYEIAPGQDVEAVAGLLSRFQPTASLVFCTTKRDCDDLAAALRQMGFAASALHGDLEQRERDSTLVQFANQSCTVLVATDVAARGLDIKGLPLVINAEPARDPEVYTHRIGRTGRAGEQGHAVTLCTPKQGHKITRLESARGMTAEWGDTAQLLAEPVRPVVPPMKTLCLAGGRKEKVRRGDVLGALTGEAGIPGSAVGKIDLFDFQCFVAVDVAWAGKALSRLEQGKVKGRKIRVRYV
ncbi:MAG: ATP-dependent RNA helicase DbpA [Gammaproteobacteria bacterium]|uniref:DEAD-box ATP-dependent RNA helicase RhpA n=1 Tax=Marinobacter litoralis TaxID=187981 RepID=A0A3M2RA03_9GAMM|nr:ATP-dependent RNA helicase DbpA [Marinobacter litoralis]MBR9869701.1 ATP-dependent RNA helicase DbpA [Gammaproteobacteria bacterium]RMJ02108.1 ATP-dependent RNA helicase DbpA [Marinobacter litoralis]